MNRLVVLFVGIPLLCCPGRLDADLILHLNPGANEGYFTGMEISVPGESIGGESYEFSWQEAIAFEAGFDFADISSEFLVSPDDLVGASLVMGMGTLDVVIVFEGGSTHTVTGLGPGTFSYDSFSATHQSALESLIGSSISVNLGESISSLQVVPEPSTLALLGLVVAGVVAARRMRTRLRSN